MMKKQIGLLLLLVLFGMNGNFVFGQRGGTNPTVTVVPTITHATCFNPYARVDYEVVVTSHWDNDASMNSLKLFDDSSPAQVVYDHPDNTLTGTIINLEVGVYKFTGSVTALNSSGMWVSVPFNLTIWVGIETVWTEKIDMVASPNSYSAKRNSSTTSYGGVRSSNGINSGDGWIEMKAQYGTTTDNRAFWLIGETNPLGTFNPNTNIQYIEFYKGTSGNGIKLKYETSGGTFTTVSLSTNQDDKIRLVRTGSTLTIQKNNSTATVFTLPVSYSGGMNIAVRSLALNDGCLDVVSSFPCLSDVYAKMERTLRGVKYSPVGNLLKFYVTEEYDNQSGDLNYSVFSDLDRLNPVISGIQQVHSVVYGDNRYNLDVFSLSSGSYILEVVNDKKETFYLRFVKP